jgi:hypothetical protein
MMVMLLSTKNKFIFGLCLATLLLTGCDWSVFGQPISESTVRRHVSSLQERTNVDPVPVQKPNAKPQKVEFFSQAPFADWDDIRQQDGCEEAVMLMAYLWRSDTNFNKNQFLDALLDLTNFETEKFGAHNDIHVEDMATVMAEKLGITDAYTVTDSDLITIAYLEELLDAGNLVIVPTQGKRLGNPNFSGEGPERHALLLLGYDRQNAEFIVHDPGTRKGENYRYPESVLLNAIYSYPTGHKLPVLVEEKAILVVPPATI